MGERFLPACASSRTWRISLATSFSVHAVAWSSRVARSSVLAAPSFVMSGPAVAAATSPSRLRPREASAAPAARPASAAPAAIAGLADFWAIGLSASAASFARALSLSVVLLDRGREPFRDDPAERARVERCRV